MPPLNVLEIFLLWGGGGPDFADKMSATAALSTNAFN